VALPDEGLPELGTVCRRATERRGGRHHVRAARAPGYRQ
jgi:hypothetical protein